ncbi:Hypothetical protein PFR_JS7-1_1867 [Propionibacterium freudenreichii]|nr:Hypothetical protein PFR_JS7-1_1867 [Propionibacterium freudenreichii]
MGADGANVSRMGRNARPVSKATKALAEAIREAQGAANLSGAELARRAGIPYSSFRKIREGEVTISWEQIRMIVAALGIDATDLVTRAEEIEDGFGR